MVENAYSRLAALIGGAIDNATGAGPLRPAPPRALRRAWRNLERRDSRKRQRAEIRAELRGQWPPRDVRARTLATPYEISIGEYSGPAIAPSSNAA